MCWKYSCFLLVERVECGLPACTKKYHERTRGATDSVVCGGEDRWCDWLCEIVDWIANCAFAISECVWFAWPKGETHQDSRVCFLAGFLPRFSSTMLRFSPEFFWRIFADRELITMWVTSCKMVAILDPNEINKHVEVFPMFSFHIIVIDWN